MSELETLIRQELRVRFKNDGNNPNGNTRQPSNTSKKSNLVEILDEQYLINSISRGEEAPSRATDFNDRGFHGKMSLF